MGLKPHARRSVGVGPDKPLRWLKSLLNPFLLDQPAGFSHTWVAERISEIPPTGATRNVSKAHLRGLRPGLGLVGRKSVPFSLQSPIGRSENLRPTGREAVMRSPERFLYGRLGGSRGLLTTLTGCHVPLSKATLVGLFTPWRARQCGFSVAISHRWWYN
jgi:hypothetical protein